MKRFSLAAVVALEAALTASVPIAWLLSIWDTSWQWFVTGCLSLFVAGVLLVPALLALGLLVDMHDHNKHRRRWGQHERRGWNYGRDR